MLEVIQTGLDVAGVVLDADVVVPFMGLVAQSAEEVIVDDAEELDGQRSVLFAKLLPLWADSKLFTEDDPVLLVLLSGLKLFKGSGCLGLVFPEILRRLEVEDPCLLGLRMGFELAHSFLLKEVGRCLEGLVKVMHSATLLFAGAENGILFILVVQLRDGVLATAATSIARAAHAHRVEVRVAVPPKIGAFALAKSVPAVKHQSSILKFKLL